jgi:hypothetical protein
MLSKKENFIDKKPNVLKNFNLASFSIDAGAKLYAQKIDMLHNFVSGFLKGLKKPKKKSVWIKKTNFRLKKEVIVSLTTKIQIFNAQFFFLNLIKKTTSFFINSFLKKKIFEKNFEISNCLIFFKNSFKIHLQNYFLNPKKLNIKNNCINLKYFKKIKFQVIFQILNRINKYLIQIFFFPEDEFIKIIKNFSHNFNTNFSEALKKNHLFINCHRKEKFLLQKFFFKVERKKIYFFKKKSKKSNGKIFLFKYPIPSYLKLFNSIKLKLKMLKIKYHRDYFFKKCLSSLFEKCQIYFNQNSVNNEIVNKKTKIFGNEMVNNIRKFFGIFIDHLNIS